MEGAVFVEIPVSPPVAELLKDQRTRDRLGKLVSQMLRPMSGETDPVSALISELKAEVRAAGLTDEEIDTELAACNAERRR